MIRNLSLVIRTFNTNSIILHSTTRKIHTTTCNFLSKDYYKILAISNNASQAEVKKAYYYLAKRHHPDRNPGDPKAEKLFQKVSEAYEVLGDQLKRRDYDQTINSRQSSSSYQKETGKKAKTATASTWKYKFESDPLELFRKVFGDISSDFEAASKDSSSFIDTKLARAFVTITLRESACGVSRCIKFLSSKDTLKFKDKEILVDLPAGIEDGQTLWLKIDDKQEAIVQVKVEEKSGFFRKGDDVHSDLNVSISDAVFGNVVSVQGLHSILKVKLPPKLCSHTVLKLTHQGFNVSKSSGGKIGHHYLHVKIEALKNSFVDKEEASSRHSGHREH